MVGKTIKIFIEKSKNKLSLQIAFVFFTVLTLLVSFQVSNRFFLVCTTLVLAILSFILVVVFVRKKYFKWYLIVLMLFISVLFTQKLSVDNSNQNYLLELNWDSNEIEQFDYVFLSYNVNSEWERKAIMDPKVTAWQLSDDFFQTPTISLSFGSPDIMLENANLMLYGLRLSYCGYPILNISGDQLAAFIQTKYFMSDPNEISDGQTTAFNIDSGAQIILNGENLQKKIQQALDHNNLYIWLNIRTLFLLIICSAITGKVILQFSKAIKKEVFYTILFFINIILYVFLSKAVGQIPCLILWLGEILYLTDRYFNEKTGVLKPFIVTAIFAFMILNAPFFIKNDYSIRISYSVRPQNSVENISIDLKKSQNHYRLFSGNSSNDSGPVDSGIFDADNMIISFKTAELPDANVEISIENIILFGSGVKIVDISGKNLDSDIYAVYDISEKEIKDSKTVISTSGNKYAQIFLNHTFIERIKSLYIHSIIAELLCIFFIIELLIGIYLIKWCVNRVKQFWDTHIPFIWINGLSLIILSTAQFLYLEISSQNILTIKFPEAVLNILIALIINIIICTLTNIRTGIIITDGFVTVVGVVNYFTLLYRGTPLLPWDVYSINTAVNVSGHYDLSLTWFNICCFIILFWISELCILSNPQKLNPAHKFLRKFAFKIGILFITILGSSVILSPAGMKLFRIQENVYNQKANYSSNGWLLATCLNLKYIHIEKPKGFSEKTVDDLLSKYNVELEATVLPNIIIIVNESFSDLQSIYDIKTNTEVMPFINSLSGSHVARGTCFVSQLGGGTSNTEYELLMGADMAFLPSGSIAFQQHISEKQFSLINMLNNYNYTTYGMHPMAGSNWNRTEAYPLLQFQNIVFHENLSDFNYVRNYVSDEYCYQWIIDQFEKKQSNDRLALYNLTVQNHGGYDESNYSGNITVTNVEKSETLSQYLSLIYESDQALKKLIHYFETYDEDVMILFLGDHQPALDLSGIPKKAASTMYDLYAVPYLLWNNFSAEVEIPQNISINYLASYLLKNAGIPRSAYYQFLEDLSQEYPIITLAGYTDASGKNFTWDMERDTVNINNYKILQYGLISTEILNKKKYYQ